MLYIVDKQTTQSMPTLVGASDDGHGDVR